MRKFILAVAFAAFVTPPNFADDTTPAANTQPQWNAQNIEGLIEALETLADHGLRPNDYGLNALRTIKQNDSDRHALATRSWHLAARQMLNGKLDPVSVEPDWTATRRSANLEAHLARALQTSTLKTSLETLAPTQKEYLDLKREYLQVRLKNGGNLEAVPAGPLLKAGSTDTRVILLQRRLIGLRLLKAGHITAQMDEPTLAAVKTFQEAAKLQVDGVVGPATLAALNLDKSERLNQLRVNMERWRWLPDDLGQRHVRVNIAGYLAHAYENGIPVRTHRTIVGKTYRKTPVFSDTIKYIVLNPWWEVPSSIARRDKLPAFRKNPSAITQQGYQLIDASGQSISPSKINWANASASNFPYRVRQAPGPLNALGQVKIMFPNAHQVYLHDTPNRELFNQPGRTFSSGCVRTENPVDLAEWLLSHDQGIDRPTIDAVLNSGKERRIDLKQAVPVHILYFTAVSDAAGNVSYLQDVYKRDGAILAGLSGTPSQ